jgi:hypothetical protein
MEKKLKHLEMIQGVVNRMAQCSFMLKGWSVTLVAGLLALSVATNQKIALISVSFLPLIVFWMLDGYYLYQERLFRAVYDHVRKLGEDKIDFSMDTSTFTNGRNTWTSTMMSRTVCGFYLPLLAAMIGVMAILVVIAECKNSG